MGIKTSDLDTYPLCADGPGRRGCHSVIGGSGVFTKDQRRALEQTYVQRTRAALTKQEEPCPQDSPSENGSKRTPSVAAATTLPRPWGPFRD